MKNDVPGRSPVPAVLRATAAALLLTGLCCAPPTEPAADKPTSTNSGNAFTGRLTDTDGNPVAGAKVSLFRSDHNPSGNPAAAADTVTDSTGTFRMAKPDSGCYNLIGETAELGLLMDSLAIDADTATIDIEDRIMLPFGSIKGIVHMEEQSDINQTKILLYLTGTDRIATAASGGAFRFALVPAGTYQLTAAPFYDYYDTKLITVTVISGQETDLDTVWFKIPQDTSGATDTLQDTSATDTSGTTRTVPAAVFSISPDSGTVTTLFCFDASATTDAEDDTGDLLIRWDWDGDGWDTGWSTKKTASFSFATTGTKTVKLEVLDTDGLTAVCIGTLTVYNLPPTAHFTVSPDTGDLATEFSMDASTSSDAEDASGDLQVRWDWEDDGTWDTGWLSVKTASHTYSAAGTWTVRMEAKDKDGASAATTKKITVLPGQVVGYWDCNTGSGTVLYDKSGTDRHGNIIGASWGEGVDGHGLYFDGNDMVSLDPTGLPKDSSTPFTISLWCKPDIVKKDNAGELIWWGYNPRANGLVGLIYYDYPSPATFNFSFYGDALHCRMDTTAGKWHHVAATYDGLTKKLYINGELVATGANPDLNVYTMSKFEIGHREHYFQGHMDEIKVYDYVLSDTEVKDVFNEFTPPSGSEESGPAGAWDFNDGTGEILTDYSLHGNDGTIKGTADWQTGLGGYALRFDGIDDYIDCRTGAGLDMTGDFSVSLWIKREAAWDSSGNYIPLLSKGSIYDKAGFGINIYERITDDQTRVDFWIGDGSAASVVMDAHNRTDNWKVGEWVHIAGILEGTHQKLYIDGILVDENTAASVPALNPASLMLGWDGDRYAAPQNTLKWKGLMDQCRIYSHALTDQQVADLYQEKVR